MLTGYDSTDIALIPADAEVVVCYMDRRYKNDDEARARFPHLAAAGRIVTLTAAENDADGIDIEPGNAVPDAAPGWYERQRARGRWRPIFYADRSDLIEVIASLRRAGVLIGSPGPSRPVRLFSAHPDGWAHICGPFTCGFPVECDATQHTWNPGGVNIDVDQFRSDFFPSLPPTPPGVDAMAITATANHDGRLEVFVETANGEVLHTWQVSAGGAWVGAKQGVRNAEWHTLGTPGK